jgi:hypothetical protein
MKACAFVLTALFSWLFVVALVFPVPLAGASESQALNVDEIFICKDVIGLTPVGADTRFDASTGRLFCFTKITGAQEATTVTHVWYFGESKQAWVTLEVGSARWRTYSSKAIQPHQTGPWRVEVLGPNVEVLRTVEFKVGPPGGTD